MPRWVQSGFEEYAKRLTRECRLNLIEIPAEGRSKGGQSARAIQSEGQRILASIPKKCLVVALEVSGRQWSTQQLSDQLSRWLGGGRDVVLLVGGADGLAQSCRERAEMCWSLSPLTLPHPLVRVVLAEQLYRAWSLLHNHPYHRA